LAVGIALAPEEVGADVLGRDAVASDEEADGTGEAVHAVSAPDAATTPAITAVRAAALSFKLRLRSTLGREFRRRKSDLVGEPYVLTMPSKNPTALE
jgi:hypothetical protein